KAREVEAKADRAERHKGRLSVRSRTAAVTVETALVLPIALLFILGIFEYGRYLMTMQLMNNAAREGVRYAVTHLQPVTLGATTYGNATSDVTNIVTSCTA